MQSVFLFTEEVWCSLLKVFSLYFTYFINIVISFKRKYIKKANKKYRIRMKYINEGFFLIVQIKQIIISGCHIMKRSNSF